MLLNTTYLWLYGLKAVCFSFCCNYSIYVCELRWVTFTRNDTESQQWMPVLLKSQTPSMVYGILHWEGAEKWCLGCAKEYVKLIDTRCQRPLVCMYYYNRFIQFLLLYYNIPECMGLMRIMSSRNASWRFWTTTTTRVWRAARLSRCSSALPWAARWPDLTTPQWSSTMRL